MNFSRSARRKRSICLPLGPVPNRTAGMRGCLRVACACTQSIETPNHSATSRELSKRPELLGNDWAGKIDRGWVDIESSLTSVILDTRCPPQFEILNSSLHQGRHRILLASASDLEFSILDDADLPILETGRGRSEPPPVLGWSSLYGTGDVTQFDFFVPLCPMKFQPRPIPWRNSSEQFRVIRRGSLLSRPA
jgi:hypothetical protein